MSILEYHHKELVTFLKEVRDTTPEFGFIAPKSEEWKLLNLVIDSEDGRVKHAKAAELMGKSASQLSKTTLPNLNGMLRAFSERCRIRPVVQLYFNTKGDYPGGHFACCEIAATASKSQNFIRIEDLRNLIGKAVQLLRLDPMLAQHNKPNEQTPNLAINASANITTENTYLVNPKETEEMTNESTQRLYMKLCNECEEIENAMTNAYDEKSAERFRKMWDLKRKQILELEIRMDNEVNALPRKERNKLRRELGLNEEPEL